MQWLTDSWYQTNHPLRWLLLPLSGLYRVVIFIRSLLFRVGCLRSEKLSVPVIVVGNITVGGTGKTPFVIWLTQSLQQAGYHPGIISRGYGSHNNQFPRQVTNNSNPADVGDEPVMLSRRCACPVVVDPNRVRGAHFLLDHFDCNVIITDDGYSTIRCNAILRLPSLMPNASMVMEAACRLVHYGNQYPD